MPCRAFLLNFAFAGRQIWSTFNGLTSPSRTDYLGNYNTAAEAGYPIIGP